jgi:hypothetical protein
VQHSALIKHPTRSRARKQSTKIYKARDINKGVNIDTLIERFKETKLYIKTRLLTNTKTSSIPLGGLPRLEDTPGVVAEGFWAYDLGPPSLLSSKPAQCYNYKMRDSRFLCMDNSLIAKLHSYGDLRKQSCRLKLVFSQTLKLRAFL